MTSSKQNPVPVLLLGGQENALSVIRSLTRHGVPVSLSAPESCWALRSRHCAKRYPIEKDVDRAEYWEDLLLGSGHPELRGSVIFPCNDEAIEFMAKRRSVLRREYLLDDHVANQQMELLDKQATLELAKSVGVPFPQHWNVEKPEDVQAIEGDIDFPVIIKPIHSHLFQRVYHAKLLVVNDFPELVAKVKEVLSRGLEIMVCELVPGPDDLLSSYYTYLDADGRHLFEFTKRIIRRNPINFGGGCYHITDWAPDTAEVGRKFFRGINFKGLGNIEFKLDPRDGQLKVIECNARFTAAQELLVRSGMDIAWIIYNHITGGRVPKIEGFKQGLRLWYGCDDFDSFRLLREAGKLTTMNWLRSIAHPQVFPFFAANDPLPAVVKGWSTFRKRVLRLPR